MKKIFCLTLALVMLLGLVACGSTNDSAGQNGGSAGGSTAAPTTAPAQSEALRVGYSRLKITPTTPTQMGGYGTTRLHKNVLDDLYLTCVVISDSTDNTLVFFTMDLTQSDAQVCKSLVGKINKKFGIPEENISFTATHTHSAPSMSAVGAKLNSNIVKVVEEAMEDRKPAEMFFGTAETDGLNFVRHYKMNDGSTVGDNFGTTTGKTFAGHVTEADHEMRVLQFKREGGKDVLMVNWQSHPHMTGGSTKLDMSADIVGAFRMYIEKEEKCLFAYFQGASGNINPTSRITEEMKNNPSKDYMIHGKLLSQTCQKALKNMTPVASGPVKAVCKSFEAQCDHTEDGKAADAAQVKAYFSKTQSPSETKIFAETLGLHSVYHANSIIARCDNPESKTLDTRAYCIGELGITTAPNEQFDTQGMYIRENSPFKFTMNFGYSNASMGYLASKIAFETGAYEVDNRTFVQGTAEAVADHLVGLLKELKG